MQMVLINKKNQVTWQSNNEDIRPRVLDLVWVAEDIQQHVSELKVNLEDRIRSDHAILSFTMAKQAPADDKFSIPRNSKQELEYIASLRNLFNSIAESLTELTTIDNIRDFEQQLETGMKEAWTAHATRRKPSAHSKSWWNAECSSLAKQIREVRTQMKAHPERRSRLKIELLELQRQFKKTVRSSKRKFFDDIIGETAPNRIWGLVDWTKPRKNRQFVPIKNSSGQTATSPAEIGVAFHEHFALHDNTADDSIIQEYDQVPPRTFAEISSQEIWDALKNTSASSAPGPDQCPWRCIKKALTRSSVEGFAKFFSACITKGYHPRIFKESLTVVIPKPNKSDYTKPGAYRPIALLNCLAKLMEKILSKRIQFQGQKFGIVHPYQFGGVREKSTVDAGICLAHNVKQAWRQNIDSSVLLFDIEQFYPSIRHNILVNTMRKQGFSETLCKFIESYLQERDTSYILNAHRSEKTPIPDGIPQGSPLSPILSALYIAPILHKWAPINEKQFGNASVQFFVDDGLLHVASPRHLLPDGPGDQLQLNNAIIAHIMSNLSRDLQRIGLTIASDKFEMMHFRKCREAWSHDEPLGPSVALHTHIPNSPIITVKPAHTLRYLGFFFQPKLTWNYHVKFYANKATSAIHAMRMLGNAARGLPPTSKRKLYLSNSLPIMVYGAQLWWNPTWKGIKWSLAILQKAQAHAARWISGAFRTTRQGILDLMAGLIPVKHNINNLMNKAAMRISTLPNTHPTRAPLLRSIDSSITPSFPLDSSPKTVTPLTHVRAIIETSNEEFDSLNDECQPGHRVIDNFEDKIFTHFKAPGKKSEDFKSWLTNYFLPTLDKVQEQENNIILFTDGSKRQIIQDDEVATGAAWILMRKLEIIQRGAVAYGQASPFDAEMAALANGIEAACAAAGADDTQLHIYTDNKAAIAKVINPNNGPGQMLAIQAARSVRTFLQANPCRKLHLHWCPAHCDIDANELVDKLAKKASYQPQPPHISMTEALSKLEQKERNLYHKNTARNTKILGENSLTGCEGFSTKTRKHPLFSRWGNNSAEFARATRFLSGHCPIGEYRERFNLEGPVDCICGAPIETREHLVFDCPVWIRTWNRQPRQRRATPDALDFSQNSQHDISLTAELALTFLHLNPLVASFEWADLAGKALAKDQHGQRNISLIQRAREMAHARKVP